MAELPILTQRRIEAAFAKTLYDHMAAEFGAEAARRVLASAVAEMAKSAAAEMARQEPPGQSSLDSFREILPRWTAEDALTIEVVQSTATDFDFNVTRCRYAEMYRTMGLADLGAILSCNRDGAFCEGFAADLKLTRTQTILSGADHCDFRYHLSPLAPDAGS